MTREELKQFNGRDGNKAYVGYKGKVYDVSINQAFRNGVHSRIVKAGEDITDLMPKAKHGDKVLSRMPIVADLED